MSAPVVCRLVAAVVLASVAGAQEAAPEPISFHRDVRPVLQARCQGCHQPAKDSGDVVLLAHSDLLTAIDGMPLVTPGDPSASLLIEVVTPLGDIPPAMPEDAPPLSADELALLVDWIAAGATDDTPAQLHVRPTAADPPRYTVAPVVSALAFAPDGSQLAVSGRHEVLLHDFAALASGSPAPPQRLVGLSPRIESLAYSPDGTILAVAGGAPALMGELQLWRTADAKLQRSIPVTFDTLRGVAWSPDGALLAFGCADRTLRAVDAASGLQVLFQGAHEDWVLDTTFSLDGSHLISVGRDRSAKLTKVETEQFIDNITSITPGAMTGGLLAVERHPTLDQVLIGGADGEPKLYKIYREKRREIGDDFNLIRAFEPLLGRVTDVGWAPDGARLFTCASLSIHAEPARGGSVRAYGIEGEVLWTRTFAGAMYALAVHPSGERIAAAGFDGSVRLFDAASGETLAEFVPVPIDAPGAALAPEAPEPIVVEAEGDQDAQVDAQSEAAGADDMPNEQPAASPSEGPSEKEDQS